MEFGSIVRFREREWVMLPSVRQEIWRLRPLVGTDEDVVEVHKRLSQVVCYSLPWENIQPAEFPLPRVEDVSDAAAAYLLWQAARLLLRDGAAPLRCLGRISFRPRRYQLVPLLMASRLDPVRLLIADDVGVGKTIEALLIARELFDRGQVRRMCVLCPPYLCDQWQKEIIEKIHLDAVLIRSSTISQLERQTPPGKRIYEHFPVQVASMDFVKSDRNRHEFLSACPELVIVDEVHNATLSGSVANERYSLVQEIAKEKRRHLILLTATPHSGLPDSFRSLLSFLDPDFSQWDFSDLTEEQRTRLARHFVQRTRRDIESHWEKLALFPKRDAVEAVYVMTAAYQELFEETYRFCSEIISRSKDLVEHRRRVHYWGALALLRSVMSSPAEAKRALSDRAWDRFPEEASDEWSGFVMEPDARPQYDESPSPAIEAAASQWSSSDRHRLRQLASRAGQLLGPEQDAKLRKALEVTRSLLQEGFHPILWCRYIATAEYLAEHLRSCLDQEVQVVCLTGRIGDEERRLQIQAISTDSPRVLVATDCLSEGINLQERFTAVVHYDLPWNPNRLEQREGRIDRYGQTAERVCAVLLYGKDNPVDGAVLEVLLRKAKEIRRTLGTHVPVPETSESVLEAVLNALFLRKRDRAAKQLTLDLVVPEAQRLHESWQREAERESMNRTRFAQRAIKVEEVEAELQASDLILGDPQAVQEFVLGTCQRLGLSVEKHRKRPGVFTVALNPSTCNSLPELVHIALKKATLRWRQSSSTTWYISFESPTPEGAEYLGRNHPFVTALARYLFEDALSRHGDAVAARAGVLATSQVPLLTTLWLVRQRYEIAVPNCPPQLAEEVRVLGSCGLLPNLTWLEDDQALTLLRTARAEANVPLQEKRELVRVVLEMWPQLNSQVRKRAEDRAKQLTDSYKRLRQLLQERTRGVEVRPLWPMDLLGLLVLQPRR